MGPQPWRRLLATGNSPARKWAGVCLKVTVTAGLLAWLFFKVDLSNIASVLAKTRLGYFAFAGLLSLAMMVLAALRWHLLLRAIQIRLPFRETCALTFIGAFFSDLLPSTLGGEAVRVYYAAKLVGDPGKLIFSIFIDRLIGIAALMTIPLGAALLRPPAAGRLEEAITAAYLLVLFSLLLLAAVAMWFVKDKNRFSAPPPDTTPKRILRSVMACCKLYSHEKVALAQAFGITAATHGLVIFSYYILGAAVGYDGRWLDLFFFVPMVFLVTLLPVSFGGLGLREWAFVSLFTKLGMPEEAAVYTAILYLLAKTGPSLVGAGLYLAKGGHRRE